ncbi:hypothetical protein PENTCL1PPCAC_20835, partial [Pristionchus entomophagus]
LDRPLISLFFQSLLISVPIIYRLLDREKHGNEESDCSHRENYQSASPVVLVAREREVNDYHSSRIRSKLIWSSSSVAKHD